MADLAVLQRSDNGLVYIAPCCLEDALGLASALSARQAFSVHLVASLPALGNLADAVHARLWESHVANGWFAVAVQTAVCAALPDVHDASSRDFDALPRKLPKACPRAEAPVASVIKKALKQKLGPEKTKQALAGYRELALRSGGVCKRFLVDDAGITMQLEPTIFVA